jgi:ATP-dependent RNA helicase DOB1
LSKPGLILLQLIELQQEAEKKESMIIPDEAEVAKYYDIRAQLDQMNADFKEVITHPNYALPFLQPGRLVQVKHEHMDFGWGIIINYQKRLPPKVSPT